MGTTAQKFFLSAAADDGTYGTTIEKLVEAAPAANSTTTVTWTTTAAAEKTLVPLAANSTAGDTSVANGWAFNNAGTDGLGSATGAQRWIKAGVWAFSMGVTLNTPALLATIACLIKANVYRVSAAGVSTLLFSATSANFSASATITWNSAAQPEIVLGAGEVIEIGYTSTSAATANTLNQVTNTVLTLALSANSAVTVPSPGVRTLAITQGSGAGVATLVGIGASRFAGIGSSAGIAIPVGIIGGIGGTIGQSAGAAAASGAGAARGAGVGSCAGQGTVIGKVGSITSGIGSAAGIAAAMGAIGAFFSGVGSANGIALATASIGATAGVIGSAAGVAIAQGLGSSLSGTMGAAVGVATASGRVTKIVPTVGSVDIGNGASAPTIVRRPILIFDD